MNNVAIGSSSEIDANSLVTFSTIGPNCKIGKNVRIINSIIGSGVKIGDDCSIVGSILFDDIVIESGVTVQGGCTISKGVHIKGGVAIPEYSVCSLNNYDPDENSFVSSKSANKEFFIKGVLTYLPRDMSYNKSELITSQSGYDEDEAESDLDDNIEESDEDPKDEFLNEAESLF